MKNWGEIAAHSELLAAQEIKQSFDEGNLADVEEGLTQLIETLDLIPTWEDVFERKYTL